MGHIIKITPFAAILVCLVGGCGMMMKPPTGTPQNPPFPKTASILPLATGNQWLYSLTAYDSAGNKINPSRVELHLSIAGGYGLQNDTELVTLDWNNHNQKFPAYVYKYEWEQADAGALVVYRDLYPLAIRGLYVVGEYKDSLTKLYKTEQMWLAYPADSGKTWIFNLDTSGDTASAVAMEILSTRARFFVPDANSMAAGAFYDCYLYKETSGGSVSYYYYNPDIGCVGYLNYSGGRLRESYFLKQFNGN